MENIRINIIPFDFSQIGEDNECNYIQFVNKTGPLPDFPEVVNNTCHNTAFLIF